MLADERDTIEEELQREEELHKRVIVAVANLGFHVDLVCGEKSLHCFIFSNPCK